MNDRKTFVEKLLKIKHRQQMVIIAVIATGFNKTLMPSRPVINNA